MNIDIKNTEIMGMNKGKETTENIALDGKDLEQFGKFFYLRSLIIDDANFHVDWNDKGCLL